jgi:hypothetical protein
MNQEDITVTLTATEHELVNEALMQLTNCFDVAYSYTESYKNNELRDKMNEVNILRTKFVELWANRFDDETLPEPSTGHSQVSPVPYDELVNQTPLMISHEALETIAEEAEDFLNDRDIELTSHSYENIIAQAQQHGFLV